MHGQLLNAKSIDEVSVQSALFLYVKDADDQPKFFMGLSFASVKLFL